MWPIVGTKDSLLAMKGLVWVVYVTTVLALAGGSERAIYVHLVVDGRMQ